MTQAINQIALSVECMERIKKALCIAEQQCSNQDEYDLILDDIAMMKELIEANR